MTSTTNEAIPVSGALLRSLATMERRVDHQLEAQFQSDNPPTRPVTRAYEKQQAGIAADNAIKQSRRARPTGAERLKQIGRRRKWAGGSFLPPVLRGYYSECERAVLGVIADTCKRKGFCDLCLDEIAAIAGVSRTSVQNALRKARNPASGHLSVRERPQQGGKSLTNIIRIFCKEWINWLGRSIGFKRLNSSESGVLNPLSQKIEKAKIASEGVKADPLAILMHPLRVPMGSKELNERHSIRPIGGTWGASRR